MKTLTKILSVTALVVLCVCLFTLTAFAADAKVSVIYNSSPASCFAEGMEAGFALDDGRIFKGTCPKAVGETVTDADLGSSTQIATVDVLKIAKTDHKSDNTETDDDKADHYEASTCSKNGVAYWICATCNQHLPAPTSATTGEKTLALAAHTPGATVPKKDADCLNDGNIDYAVCTVCGALLDTSTPPKEIASYKIPATGAHVWTEWIILKDPTNVSPGNQKRTCTVCGTVEYQEIPALGITDAPYNDLWYVVPLHDTWLRGEEALTFDSNLVEKLNAESGKDANYVGVRIGTDSLYENSYDTFDFWSWDRYIKLGDKTMQGLREGKYRIWVYDKRNPKEYTTSCDFWVVDVPTLEPYSTDKHVVNSSKSLRFIASEEIDPNSVQVGSRKLYDANDFFVSNDRKSITLSPDFLNARQTGTYTISAQTKDGHRTIKTNFYILSTAQASSSPRTGDESQIGLWAAFLLLSGAAVVVLVPKLRKQGVK